MIRKIHITAVMKNRIIKKEEPLIPEIFTSVLVYPTINSIIFQVKKMNKTIKRIFGIFIILGVVLI